MSVLALEQTSFWLGVLVTVIAQLWAVSVAVAEFVAAGASPKASPWTETLLVVVVVIVALRVNVTAFAAPGFSVVLLPLAVVLPPTGIEPTLIVTSSDLSLGVPRSSTILPFVISTLPVLSNL